MIVFTEADLFTKFDMQADSPRILYVEDHSDAAEMLRIELTAGGEYNVTIAGSGEEALELLRGEAFDL